MPKRKKLPKVPDYTGVASFEKMVVQKSNPLQTLSKTSMNLSSFKILDAYLSRINSHDEDKRFIRFEKGELESLLGISKINKDDLTARLENLFQVVTIEDETKRQGFTKIALFEKAEAVQDDNGQWIVDLACTPSAMEYVFNIDNIGYLKYRLRSVVNLTSRYSYILFLYLENNRFRHSWTVDVMEFKEILGCTSEAYEKFYRFNDLTLKKAYLELHEKTECRFTYEPIKKGRSVVAIRFTMEQFEAIDAAQISQISIEELSLDIAADDPISFLQDACRIDGGEPEFDRTQMNEIFQVLAVLPEDKLPTVPEDDILFRRYHYLAYKYAVLCRNDKPNDPIKRRFAYFIKSLKTDAGL